MNLALLAKVWALAGSANAGEAAAARERARTMVEREGKTLADVPGLLRGHAKPAAAGQEAPQHSPGGFAFYDTNNPAHLAAWAERDRKRREDQARRDAPGRAEVLARYGGLDAALAWTEREQLLRASVAAWSVFEKAPRERWTFSVDGHQLESSSEPSARVLHALSTAYPLPSTVTDAAAEFAAWEDRDRDLGLVLESAGASQLDLSAYLRRDMVRTLLETGLRSVSIAEVLIRQRHAVASDMSEPEIEKAVLADLEHLAALTAHRDVQNGQAAEAAPPSFEWSTATARRHRVRELLSHVDTAGLPDREIARRVGVSPQTVGNLRRQMRQRDLFTSAA